jgi:cystathionine gamma-synthase
MEKPGLNPGGVVFLGHGDEGDLATLQHLLSSCRSNPTERIIAVFTEFPSNPLLKCYDLKRSDAISADS